MLFRPAVGHLVVVAWMGCWMVVRSGGVIVQTSETYVTFPVSFSHRAIRGVNTPGLLAIGDYRRLDTKE